MRAELPAPIEVLRAQIAARKEPESACEDTFDVELDETLDVYLG